MDNLKLRRKTFPIIKFNDGTLEGIKWLAVLLMTIDHANRVFYDNNYLGYCLGRLAMPLFAFILGYNLARANPSSSRVYLRTFMRLMFFGLLATPAYMMMKGTEHWIPLNIMFTLGLAVLIIFIYEEGGHPVIPLAALLFLIGGLFVEYSWPGIMLCISTWYLYRKNSLNALLVWIMALVALQLFNGNNWALGIIPILLFTAQLEITIPRFPYFFYIYYPLHLTILLLLKN